MLTRFTWEEDETGLVSLETSNVGGQRFLAVVCAAGVNGDTDCWGQLAWDTGFLNIFVSLCFLYQNIMIWKYFFASQSFCRNRCFAKETMRQGKLRAYLQFLYGETTTSSCSSVVLDRWALNNRSQSVDWTRSNSGGLGDTSVSASVLATWLVKVHTHSSLPILVKVIVGNLVVVLDGLQ